MSSPAHEAATQQHSLPDHAHVSHRSAGSFSSSSPSNTSVSSECVAADTQHKHSGMSSHERTTLPAPATTSSPLSSGPASVTATTAAAEAMIASTTQNGSVSGGTTGGRRNTTSRVPPPPAPASSPPSPANTATATPAAAPTSLSTARQEAEKESQGSSLDNLPNLHVPSPREERPTHRGAFCPPLSPGSSTRHSSTNGANYSAATTRSSTSTVPSARRSLSQASGNTSALPTPRPVYHAKGIRSSLTPALVEVFPTTTTDVTSVQTSRGSSRSRSSGGSGSAHSSNHNAAEMRAAGLPSVVTSGTSSSSTMSHRSAHSIADTAAPSSPLLVKDSKLHGSTASAQCGAEVASTAAQGSNSTTTTTTGVIPHPPVIGAAVRSPSRHHRAELTSTDASAETSASVVSTNSTNSSAQSSVSATASLPVPRSRLKVQRLSLGSTKSLNEEKNKSSGSKPNTTTNNSNNNNDKTVSLTSAKERIKAASSLSSLPPPPMTTSPANPTTTTTSRGVTTTSNSSGAYGTTGGATAAASVTGAIDSATKSSQTSVTATYASASTTSLLSSNTNASLTQGRGATSQGRRRLRRGSPHRHSLSSLSSPSIPSLVTAALSTAGSAPRTQRAAPQHRIPQQKLSRLPPPHPHAQQQQQQQQRDSVDTTEVDASNADLAAFSNTHFFEPVLPTTLHARHASQNSLSTVDSSSTTNGPGSPHKESVLPMPRVLDSSSTAIVEAPPSFSATLEGRPVVLTRLTAPSRVGGAGAIPSTAVGAAASTMPVNASPPQLLTAEKQPRMNMDAAAQRKSLPPLDALVAAASSSSAQSQSSSLSSQQQHRPPCFPLLSRTVMSLGNSSITTPTAADPPLIVVAAPGAPSVLSVTAGASQLSDALTSVNKEPVGDHNGTISTVSSSAPTSTVPLKRISSRGEVHNVVGTHPPTLNAFDIVGVREAEDASPMPRDGPARLPLPRPSVPTLQLRNTALLSTTESGSRPSEVAHPCVKQSPRPATTCNVERRLSAQTRTASPAGAQSHSMAGGGNTAASTAAAGAKAGGVAAPTTATASSMAASAVAARRVSTSLPTSPTVGLLDSQLLMPTTTTARLESLPPSIGALTSATAAGVAPPSPPSAVAAATDTSAASPDSGRNSRNGSHNNRTPLNSSRTPKQPPPLHQRTESRKFGVSSTESLNSRSGEPEHRGSADRVKKDSINTNASQNVPASPSSTQLLAHRSSSRPFATPTDAPFTASSKTVELSPSLRTSAETPCPPAAAGDFTSMLQISSNFTTPFAFPESTDTMEDSSTYCGGSMHTQRFVSTSRILPLRTPLNTGIASAHGHGGSIDSLLSAPTRIVTAAAATTSATATTTAPSAPGRRQRTSADADKTSPSVSVDDLILATLDGRADEGAAAAAAAPLKSSRSGPFQRARPTHSRSTQDSVSRQRSGNDLLATSNKHDERAGRLPSSPRASSAVSSSFTNADAGVKEGNAIITYPSIATFDSDESQSSHSRGSRHKEKKSGPAEESAKPTSQPHQPLHEDDAISGEEEEEDQEGEEEAGKDNHVSGSQQAHRQPHSRPRQDRLRGAPSPDTQKPIGGSLLMTATSGRSGGGGSSNGTEHLSIPRTPQSMNSGSSRPLHLNSTTLRSNTMSTSDDSNPITQDKLDAANRSPHRDSLPSSRSGDCSRQDGPWQTPLHPRPRKRSTTLMLISQTASRLAERVRRSAHRSPRSSSVTSRDSSAEMGQTRQTSYGSNSPSHGFSIPAAVSMTLPALADNAASASLPCGEENAQQTRPQSSTPRRPSPAHVAIFSSTSNHTNTGGEGRGEETVESLTHTVSVESSSNADNDAALHSESSSTAIAAPAKKRKRSLVSAVTKLWSKSNDGSVGSRKSSVAPSSRDPDVAASASSRRVSSMLRRHDSSGESAHVPAASAEEGSGTSSARGSRAPSPSQTVPDGQTEQRGDGSASRKVGPRSLTESDGADDEATLSTQVVEGVEAKLDVSAFRDGSPLLVHATATPRLSKFSTLGTTTNAAAAAATTTTAAAGAATAAGEGTGAVEGEAPPTRHRPPHSRTVSVVESEVEAQTPQKFAIRSYEEVPSAPSKPSKLAALSHRLSSITSTTGTVDPAFASSFAAGAAHGTAGKTALQLAKEHSSRSSGDTAMTGSDNARRPQRNSNTTSGSTNPNVSRDSTQAPVPWQTVSPLPSGADVQVVRFDHASPLGETLDQSHSLSVPSSGPSSGPPSPSVASATGSTTSTTHSDVSSAGRTARSARSEMSVTTVRKPKPSTAAVVDAKVPSAAALTARESIQSAFNTFTKLKAAASSNAQLRSGSLQSSSNNNNSDGGSSSNGGTTDTSFSVGAVASMPRGPSPPRQPPVSHGLYDAFLASSAQPAPELLAGQGQAPSEQRRNGTEVARAAGAGPYPSQCQPLANASNPFAIAAAVRSRPSSGRPSSARSNSSRPGSARRGMSRPGSGGFRVGTSGNGAAARQRGPASAFHSVFHTTVADSAAPGKGGLRSELQLQLPPNTTALPKAGRTGGGLSTNVFTAWIKAAQALFPTSFAPAASSPSPLVSLPVPVSSRTPQPISECAPSTKATTSAAAAAASSETAATGNGGDGVASREPRRRVFASALKFSTPMDPTLLSARGDVVHPALAATTHSAPSPLSAAGGSPPYRWSAAQTATVIGFAPIHNTNSASTAAAARSRWSLSSTSKRKWTSSLNSSHVSTGGGNFHALPSVNSNNNSNVGGPVAGLLRAPSGSSSLFPSPGQNSTPTSPQSSRRGFSNRKFAVRHGSGSSSSNGGGGSAAAGAGGGAASAYSSSNAMSSGGRRSPRTHKSSGSRQPPSPSTGAHGAASGGRVGSAESRRSGQVVLMDAEPLDHDDMLSPSTGATPLRTSVSPMLHHRASLLSNGSALEAAHTIMAQARIAGAGATTTTTTMTAADASSPQKRAVPVPSRRASEANPLDTPLAMQTKAERGVANGSAGSERSMGSEENWLATVLSTDADGGVPMSRWMNGNAAPGFTPSTMSLVDLSVLLSGEVGHPQSQGAVHAAGAKAGAATPLESETTPTNTAFTNTTTSGTTTITTDSSAQLHGAASDSNSPQHTPHGRPGQVESSTKSILSNAHHSKGAVAAAAAVGGSSHDNNNNSNPHRTLSKHLSGTAGALVSPVSQSILMNSISFGSNAGGATSGTYGPAGGNAAATLAATYMTTSSSTTATHSTDPTYTRSGHSYSPPPVPLSCEAAPALFTMSHGFAALQLQDSPSSNGGGGTVPPFSLDSDGPAPTAASVLAAAKQAGAKSGTPLPATSSTAGDKNKNNNSHKKGSGGGPWRTEGAAVAGYGKSNLSGTATNASTNGVLSTARGPTSHVGERHGFTSHTSGGQQTFINNIFSIAGSSGTSGGSYALRPTASGSSNNSRRVSRHNRSPSYTGSTAPIPAPPATSLPASSGMAAMGSIHRGRRVGSMLTAHASNNGVMGLADPTNSAVRGSTFSLNSRHGSAVSDAPSETASFYLNNNNAGGGNGGGSPLASSLLYVPPELRRGPEWRHLQQHIAHTVAQGRQRESPLLSRKNSNESFDRPRVYSSHGTDAAAATGGGEGKSGAYRHFSGTRKASPVTSTTPAGALTSNPGSRRSSTISGADPTRKHQVVLRAHNFPGPAGTAPDSGTSRAEKAGRRAERRRSGAGGNPASPDSDLRVGMMRLNSLSTSSAFDDSVAALPTATPRASQAYPQAPLPPPLVSSNVRPYSGRGGAEGSADFANNSDDDQPFSTRTPRGSKTLRQYGNTSVANEHASGADNSGDEHSDAFSQRRSPMLMSAAGSRDGAEDDTASAATQHRLSEDRRGTRDSTHTNSDDVMACSRDTVNPSNATPPAHVHAHAHPQQQQQQQQLGQPPSSQHRHERMLSGVPVLLSDSDDDDDTSRDTRSSSGAGKAFSKPDIRRGQGSSTTTTTTTTTTAAAAGAAAIDKAHAASAAADVTEAQREMARTANYNLSLSFSFPSAKFASTAPEMSERQLALMTEQAMLEAQEAARDARNVMDGSVGGAAGRKASIAARKGSRSSNTGSTSTGSASRHQSSSGRGASASLLTKKSSFQSAPTYRYERLGGSGYTAAQKLARGRNSVVKTPTSLSDHFDGSPRMSTDLRRPSADRAGGSSVKDARALDAAAADNPASTRYDFSGGASTPSLSIDADPRRDDAKRGSLSNSDSTKPTTSETPLMPHRLAGPPRTIQSPLQSVAAAARRRQSEQSQLAPHNAQRVSPVQLERQLDGPSTAPAAGAAVVANLLPSQPPTLSGAPPGAQSETDDRSVSELFSFPVEHPASSQGQQQQQQQQQPRPHRSLSPTKPAHHTSTEKNDTAPSDRISKPNTDTGRRTSATSPHEPSTQQPDMQRDAGRSARKISLQSDLNESSLQLLSFAPLVPGLAQISSPLRPNAAARRRDSAAATAATAATTNAAAATAASPYLTTPTAAAAVTAAANALNGLRGSSEGPHGRGSLSYTGGAHRNSVVSFEEPPVMGMDTFSQGGPHAALQQQNTVELSELKSILESPSTTTTTTNTTTATTTGTAVTATTSTSESAVMRSPPSDAHRGIGGSGVGGNNGDFYRSAPPSSAGNAAASKAAHQQSSNNTNDVSGCDVTISVTPASLSPRTPAKRQSVVAPVVPSAVPGHSSPSHTVSYASKSSSKKRAASPGALTTPFFLPDCTMMSSINLNSPSVSTLTTATNNVVVSPTVTSHMPQVPINVVSVSGTLGTSGGAVSGGTGESFLMSLNDEHRTFMMLSGFTPRQTPVAAPPLISPREVGGAYDTYGGAAVPTPPVTALNGDGAPLYLTPSAGQFLSPSSRRARRARHGGDAASAAAAAAAAASANSPTTMTTTLTRQIAGQPPRPPSASRVPSASSTTTNTNGTSMTTVTSGSTASSQRLLSHTATTTSTTSSHLAAAPRWHAFPTLSSPPRSAAMNMRMNATGNSSNNNTNTSSNTSNSGGSSAQNAAHNHRNTTSSSSSGGGGGGGGTAHNVNYAVLTTANSNGSGNNVRGSEAASLPRPPSKTRLTVSPPSPTSAASSMQRHK